MEIQINENIKYWREDNRLDLSPGYIPSALMADIARISFPKERISIGGRWFDVIPNGELVRNRSESDRYYRVIYIQLNFETGEYYIGKANRPTWKELRRYQGSGLKFIGKYHKHKNDFVRFYIVKCSTAEETEKKEASIVDRELLADVKCLNLVAGGGGTNKHPSIAETSDKKREHMRNHPEQYKPMLEASMKAFSSGDTPALRARSRRIKEVMNSGKYSALFRDRIRNWKEENPEEYAEARRMNHESIKTPEIQQKRKDSLKKWVENNSAKYKAWQAKRIRSVSSPEAREKRKASLKEWRENHPEVAQTNDKKRAQAAAARTNKAICMIDLETKETLKTFPSQHSAARWLVENGIARTTNCVTSISQVCLCKPRKDGRGYRKQAYGYGWRFAEDVYHDK